MTRAQTAEAALARYVLPASANDCWPWRGPRNRWGYGVCNVFGRQVKGHRLAYEQARGPIPPGMVVRHACDNPPCCNPAHLSVGTGADNSRDAVERNRTPYGERQWMAVLTEADVLQIRRRRAAGELLRVLAADFSVSEPTISDIAAGRTWRRAGQEAS